MALIEKRLWRATPVKNGPEILQEGWYLFGFIPLYIRDMSARCRKK